MKGPCISIVYAYMSCYMVHWYINIILPHICSKVINCAVPSINLLCHHSIPLWYFDLKAFFYRSQKLFFGNYFCFQNVWTINFMIQCAWQSTTISPHYHTDATVLMLTYEHYHPKANTLMLPSWSYHHNANVLMLPSAS